MHRRHIFKAYGSYIVIKETLASFYVVFRHLPSKGMWKREGENGVIPAKNCRFKHTAVFLRVSPLSQYLVDFSNLTNLTLDLILYYIQRTF